MEKQKSSLQSLWGNKMNTNKIDLGKLGFVELIDFMGSDKDILQAARVSTGSNPSKGDAQDEGLIRYLYKNKHSSPFEMCEFKFHIKMPIFVFRQMVRHRTFSFNEYSLRYSEPINEFYLPNELEWRLQGEKNHQGSGEPILAENGASLTHLSRSSMMKDKENYETLIRQGVSREQARILLPLAQMTEVYAKVDLRNLFYFLSLRQHSHAQKEIRDFADAMLLLIKNTNKFPWSIKIFEEMRIVEEAISEAISGKVDLKDFAEYITNYRLIRDKE